MITSVEDFQQRYQKWKQHLVCVWLLKVIYYYVDEHFLLY